MHDKVQFRANSRLADERPHSNLAADRIELDDLHFLISARFQKVGSDLVLSDDHGQKLVLASYFSFAKHPDLVSHGAVLSGDLVARLAGAAPVHYAQAGAPAGALVIGHCDRLLGRVTVQHANGAVDEIKQGDAVLQGDVIQTSDGASITFSLVDGTAFNMGADARMVLSELIYDPNSSSNSATISLLKGAFTFVAGQVAHTGDMKVDTPVAVMGIRGTTVNAFIDTDVTGNVYSFTASLMADPGGGNGQFDVLDRVTGAVLYHAASTATSVTFTPGANFQVSVQEAPKSPAQVQQELATAQILFPVYLSNPANAVPAGPQQQSPQQQQQQQTQPPNNSLSTANEQPQPNQEVLPTTSIAANVTSAAATAPTLITAVLQNIPLANPQQQTGFVNTPLQALLNSQSSSKVSTDTLLQSQPIPPSVTINADNGIGNNIINHAVAQTGITLSGNVSGLAGGGTFTLLVTDGSFSKSYTATVNSAGTGWTATIPNIDATGFTNGTLTVTAQVANQAGSAQVNQTFTVAETLPTVTINAIEGLTTNVINHSIAAAGISISGMVTGLTPGATFTITLTDGSFSKTYTAGVNSAGVEWTATVPSSDALALAAGILTVTAQVTDQYGNQSLPAMHVFTIAGTPPVLTVPGSQTVGLNHATAIAGVSLAESGSSANETFTVTLSDSQGLLSASGAGVLGSGTTKLTISGSLDQVNAELATLSDTDPSSGSDTITLTAKDSFGNQAPTQTIAVTASGGPVLTVPGSQTVGLNHATAIAGVSLAESGSSANETFTVTLSDSQGLLSASGAGVLGSGTTKLTISGSLDQVNAELATLSDTDPSSGSDTITLTAKDSFGNQAPTQTIAVTASGGPVLTVPGSQTVGLNHATAIAGVSLAESGSSANETFTVTLSDSQGLLSASGAGVLGSGTTKLTISGSLDQVNAELATLSDTDPSSGSDTITLTAKDSFGNQAPTQTIAVTASGGPVLTVPGSQTVGLNHATAIAGVSLAESGSSANETFTVTLSDSQGLLSASGAGVLGSGTTKLTISGSLDQVNAELATLSDTDPSSGSDTITLTAKDSFGNQAPTQTIAVTASGGPVLTVPGSQTVGLNHATAIAGVSLAESGSSANETFTVTLSDSQGLLSASGAGVLGSGTTKLTISGSLDQVNAELATLSDTDPSSGSDTITLTAKDSFGNQAPTQTIAVTASGGPVLTVPGSQTVGLNHATAIAGVSLAESGSSANETFTVTLSDSQGLLSASGAGVLGSGTTKLTISGSLDQVNAELATLSDTDPSSGSDTITLTAKDSFGNQAPTQTIAVTAERRAGADGAGVADGWSQPCDGDCRGEPGGERQQRERDVHGDAERQSGPCCRRAAMGWRDQARPN